MSKTVLFQSRAGFLMIALNADKVKPKIAKFVAGMCCLDEEDAKLLIQTKSYKQGDCWLAPEPKKAAEPEPVVEAKASTPEEAKPAAKRGRPPKAPKEPVPSESEKEATQ